jgi:hypothetical protein
MVKMMANGQTPTQNTEILKTLTPVDGKKTGIVPYR